MIVTKENISKAIADISKYKYISLDTETYGLRWTDTIFSLILSVGDTPIAQDYYFNFNSGVDVYGAPMGEALSKEDVYGALRHLFEDTQRIWCIQNAIFDLNMLHKDGVELKGQIHCTKGAARVLDNDRMSYSLDELGRVELSVRKDDKVKKFINTQHQLTAEDKKNKVKGADKPKCYEQEQIPGKKTKTKRMFFDKVPFDIIVPYGERDGRLVHNLMRKQVPLLKDFPAWETEKKMPQVVSRMICKGLRVDPAYCQTAIEHEKTLLEQAKYVYAQVAGVTEYKAGRLQLQEVFNRFGLPYEYTDKGNPKFDEASVEKVDHPAIEQLLTIREHEKRIGTYYSSFLYHRDQHDFIHPFLDPYGTRTYRFSSSDPNMQNVPKEAEEGLTHYVRKCFIPDNDDYLLLFIDQDQVEYRMLLDYAEETALIYDVLAGRDVHTALAERMGVERSVAKTLNYAILYGVGAAKLGRMLKVSEAQAKVLKQSFFEAMPGVRDFVKTCMSVAKQKRAIRTWDGHWGQYRDENFVYKAPNFVIQGGCAGVVKRAMVQLDEFLRPYKTHMKLQVHDELVFGLHKSETFLVPEIKRIMEEVYTPMNGMKLTCSVNYSDVSWGYPDLKKWVDK